MTVSTRHLDGLPTPARLRELSQTLASLCESLGDGFFAFDPAWRRGEALASMKNDEGDFYFVWFGKKGVVIRGYDHTCAMRSTAQPGGTPWPGLFDGLPRSLHYALEEPAFCLDEVSFCIWSAAGGPWQTGRVRYPRGADPDGSRGLLSLLDDRPRTFVGFAREYYGRRLDVRQVTDVYAGKAGAEVLLPKAKAASDDDDDETIGEAEFKVIQVGDVVSMVVGGKIVASREDAKLYDRLFDKVKAALKG